LLYQTLALSLINRLGNLVVDVFFFFLNAPQRLAGPEKGYKGAYNPGSCLSHGTDELGWQRPLGQRQQLTTARSAPTLETRGKDKRKVKVDSKIR
jgi:hypothetical protein